VVSLVESLPVPAPVFKAALVPAELPRIAGYESLRLLGRGGMGVVYLARQVTLDRLVAVKMALAGVHAAPEQQARFRTEAEAAARLQHPNIIQIFEIGASEGQPFLTMEYVAGGSLSAHLDGKPQPWQSAAAFLATLASAVQHAHERGIVHRDLKPDNILLQLWEAQDSTTPVRLDLAIPKITDFGIAKLLAEGESNTPSGAILGTPGYMAPEQVGGAEPVGPSSDIHALGAILYELLTGRLPFHSEDMLETLEQIRYQEPIPPRRRAAFVPADLETICLKCLHKIPAQRYASAQALGEDLRRCIAGEPIQARRISVPERGWKWIQRNPIPTALFTVSSLALLALIAVIVGQAYSVRLQKLNNELGYAIEIARSAQAEAEEQRTAVGNLERWVRYLRDIHLADEAWQNGQVQRISGLLAHCPADLRGWEWHYLQGLVHKNGRALQHHSGVFCLAFDPGSRLLASGCQDGSVWLWDLQTGASRTMAEQHAGTVWSVAFTSDGRLLASAGDDRRVRIWESATGRLVRILHRHGGPLRSVVFSPDGTILAAAGKDGAIKLWDPRRGEEVRILPGHPGGVASLAFASNGRLLASCGTDRLVRLWDPDSGAVVRSLEGHVEDIRGVAFSLDSKVLASAASDGTLQTWEVATGKALSTLNPLQRVPLLGVAMGPQDRLAAASESHMVYFWDKEVLHTLRGHNHRIQAAAFSPDGQYLASASPDWSVRLWPVNEAQEYKQFPMQRERGLGGSFGLQGRQVTDVALDGAIRVWDVKSGQLVRNWEAELDRPRSVAFSRNGRLLAGAGRKGRIACYDLNSRTLVHDWSHGASARAVAFSPNEACLASADDDGVIKVWSLISDRQLYMCKGHAGPVRALAFSPDGRILASGSLDGVRLWDAAAGNSLYPPIEKTPRVVALAFSPGGQLAVAQMGGNVTIWDPGASKCLATLVGHGAMVWSLAFTPDGTRLASASRDLTVKLWDVASGQEVLTLRGFSAEVIGVAFNEDASSLVTTDLAGSVRIWEAFVTKAQRSRI
jgi:WD40 repeat protein/serine/threonine protein kinase